MIQSFIPSEGRFVDVEIPEPTMSAKSINAYNTAYPHRAPVKAPSITPSCYPSHRAAKTAPPPAPMSYAAEVRAHAAKLREAAARILAQVNDLEETASKLEGK